MDFVQQSTLERLYVERGRKLDKSHLLSPDYFVSRILNHPHYRDKLRNAIQDASQKTESKDSEKRSESMPNREILKEALHNIQAGESLIKTDLEKLLEGVYLSRFVSGTESDLFTYEVGLYADTKKGVVLTNPQDTVLMFGGHHDREEMEASDLEAFSDLDLIVNSATKRAHDLRVKTQSAFTSSKKKGEKSCDNQSYSIPCSDLIIKFWVDQKGGLSKVILSGRRLEIQFSTQLIKPLKKVGYKRYIPESKRLALVLGNNSIILQQGVAPRLKNKVFFPEETLALITKSNTKCKLNDFTLGGSFLHPKLLFNNVELL